MSIVRTAYAFSPTSISNCALWLDGADSSSFTLSGSAVTQWNDKSGNGGHATQSTSGNRPTFTGSGVIFNAASSQSLLLNTPFTSTHSIYIVATPTSASQVYLFGRTYPSGHPTFIINYTGSSLEYYPGGDGSTRTTFASPTSTFIAGYVRNFGTSVFGRYNGNQVTISAAPTSEGSSLAWGSLGCSAPIYGNFYTGTIYEFMIFNTAALSTTQCQTIEGYLAQKWGLTSSLPAGHPGRTSRIYRSDYLVPNRLKPTPYYTQFSPRQILGCSLWLDAADSSTITLSGSNVTNVADKSGNGVVLSNATGFTYPNRSFNGTYPSFLCLNGGGGQANAAATLGYNSAFAQTTPFTVFFVSHQTQAGVGYIMDSQSGGSRQYTYNNTLSTPFGNSGADVTSTPSVVSMTWISGTSVLYLNGTSSYSGALGSFTTGGIIVGNRFSINESWPGHICELIYYNGQLGTSQRQQVESYLAQKWGLTASLPGGHSHLTQPAGAVTTVAKTKFKITGLPGIIFASTGLVITHQDGRTWKATANNPGYANYAIGLNSGTSMSLNIYAGGDVFNSAGGRVALLYNGDTNNAVRHAGYIMWTSTFAANNYDFGWKFVSSGSGYLIYNDYPSIGSAWQVTYDSGQDRVLIQPPGAGTYGMVWNITPRVTLAYVYSSY